MACNYYRSSDWRPSTMTVGELIEQLRQHDPAKPVIFRSPLYGAFGSNTSYSIDEVLAEAVERTEEQHPAIDYIDPETGEAGTSEAWTQVFEAWDGVVIA